MEPTNEARQTRPGGPGTHSGLRAAAGNLALASASLLAALLLAEWGAGRMLAAPPKLYPATRFDSLDLVRNSLGYRDFEHQVGKPPGVFRILVLGDSFTEGGGVGADDVWPKRLERLLNLYRGRNGQRYEVVSMAASGSSTPRQLGILLGQGLRFSPDLVVVGYCLNDPEDEDDHRGAAINPRLIFRDYGARSAAARWLSRRSALYRLVVARLRNNRINDWTLAYYRDIYRDDYPGWRKARAALEGFGKLRDERGIPVAALVFPLLSWSLDDSYPLAYAHDAVRRAFDAAKLPFLDLFPVYRGLEHTTLEAVPGRDPHPNDVAHRLAAEALLEWLDAQGLLPGGPLAGAQGPISPIPSPY